MRPFSAFIYMCAYPRYCHLGAAAQTDANLSAHLHRLPTPPPYLRRMRLSPGRGAAFLQITFHAGCRHTHFWQGIAWMVRPICAHRARCRKLISWLLDIYILEACAVICTKATLRFPMQLPLFPSTKSRFFCSRCGKDAREEVDGASGITKMTFVKLIAHSNTHCCLRRPDHSPVPGAGRTTKKDDQYLLVVLFCLACVLSVFTLQAAIYSVLERR